MKPFVRVVLLALAYFFPIAASATYVYNTITYPGAVHTEVRGINNAGQLVGYASLDGTSFFGFTYQSGAFTALPPTLYPVAGHGINDAGIVVGTANFSPTTPGIGFIFNAGTYAFFSRPGWYTTYARAIGPSNLITGYSENPVTGDTAGYIYDPIAATYTDISPPGSLLTIAQGINAAGQVVGSAILSPGGAHAFLREPGGAITLFQIGSLRTYARGINDTGLIAGFTSPPAAASAQSFVGTSSGFETLMVPGSDDTFAEGINNAGQVAGLYHAGGVAHGFIATPASMPTGTTSGGAYTFSVAVIPNFPIFIDPPVAVGYDYATGRGDPNFATVRLPIGVGDSSYRVKVRGRKFTLAGGDLFDFRANGFPDGVDAFRVGCIEVAAGLDPANVEAFPTELTFVAAGRFTGTMKPLARNSASRGNGGCDID
jgi:probable HAF family extracellular repeat protein